MVVAKSMFILRMNVHFSRLRPFNMQGAHIIPFELLLFSPTRYEISEKIRALACQLFQIFKVSVHDVGLCTASTISQACDPT